MSRWLVISSGDRPELWVTWASFYGGAGKIEVLFDRRQGQTWPGRGDRPDRRTQPDRDADLQERGFLAIPLPEIVGASR